MEITPEQWTELNERVARIDARLTAQEGQGAYHNKLLVTGNGYPPIPETVRAQSARIDGMDTKIDEVRGMVRGLVDAEKAKEEKSEDRRWDLWKIVIALALTQITINYIVPLFLKP